MLDDFREWLSDNLRYILLGFSILLVFIIIFCVVKLIGGSGKKNSPDTTVQTNQTAAPAENGAESMTEGEAAAPAAAPAPTSASSELIKDDAAILTLVQQYYTAVAESNHATLSTIVEPWDSDVQAKTLNTDMIEAYQSITTYSKKGINEGEYVVFAYYEAKLKDIETLVPSLSMFYVITATNGSLKVYSARETDSEVSAFCTQAASTSDVVTLISQVNAQYEQALAADDSLKSYLASAVPASDDTAGGDAAAEDTAAAGGAESASSGETMTATTTLNIRQTASTSAAIMGVLPEGTSVTVLSDSQDGWVQIEYATSGGNIQGYVMLEYLKAGAAQSDAA